MGNIYLEKIAEMTREDLNKGRQYGNNDFLNPHYYEHGSRPTVKDSLVAVPLGAVAGAAVGAYGGVAAGLGAHAAGLPGAIGKGVKYGAGAGAVLGGSLLPFKRYSSLKSTQNFDHEAERLGISKEDRAEYVNNRSDFNSELPASSRAIAVHKLLNPTFEAQ